MKQKTKKILISIFISFLLSTLLLSGCLGASQGKARLNKGGVLFADENGGVIEDASSFFWNNSTKKLYIQNSIVDNTNDTWMMNNGEVYTLNNVGIGTNNPQDDFDVYDDGSVSIIRVETGGSGSAGLRIKNSVKQWLMQVTSQGHYLWRNQADTTSIFYLHYNAPSYAFKVWNNEMIINEDSYNYNLRVESDNNANMLFVDGENDRIGIGINNPLYPLHVYGDMGVKGKIKYLIGNNEYYQMNISGVGGFQFQNLGLGNDMFYFVNKTGIAKFVSNFETGETRIGKAGTPNYMLTVYGDSVFNEDGEDNDFRVENDNNNKAFFVDGNNNQIGMFTNIFTIGMELDVEGDIQCTSLTETSDERIKDIIKELPKNKVKQFCENITIWLFKFNNTQFNISNSGYGVGIIAQELYNYTVDMFGEQYANCLVNVGSETVLWSINYKAISMIFARYTQILNNDIQYLYNYLGIPRG